MSISEQSPQYVVDQEFRIPTADYPARMAAIPPSRMFMIKQSLKVYAKRVPGGECYDASQGDGGASLGGVAPEVLDAAYRLQVDHGTAYDMPFGCDDFRRAVLEDYWQVDSGLGLEPGSVIATQGGRDALAKAYTAMLALGEGRVGDVIVTSRVPWISYNWGPYGVGANVMLAPGEPEAGWSYTVEGIQACVDQAAADGRKVAGIIVTAPDNPTGATLTMDRQVELGKAALRAGIKYVLYDWMYHWVTDEKPMDINAFLGRFDAVERGALMILDGIAKSLGASNIRNAHLIAAPEVNKFIQSRASHGVIPSYFSQAVAIAAYRMGFQKASASIVEPTNASRGVVKRFVAERGWTTITGQGYYAFINVRRWLRASGLTDSEKLGAVLAEQHGLATVPGVYFSSWGSEWIRFSYALPPDRTASALQRLDEGLSAIEG